MCRGWPAEEETMWVALVVWGEAAAGDGWTRLGGIAVDVV